MKTLSPNSAHPIYKLIQQCKNIATLKQVHAYMITTGLILHTYPLSKILITCTKLSPTMSYPLTIFNQITTPTIFLFNTLISSSLSGTFNQTPFALTLYSQILTKTTLKPNNYTYPSLFKACTTQPWLHYGKILHTHVLKFLEPPYDHFVLASLLNFYSKCRKLGVSRFIFNQINKPDLASWNSILTAYAHNNNYINCEASLDNVYDSASLSLEVMFLFSQMQKCMISPNEVSLVALVNACADLGALSQGMWCHCYVTRKSLKLNRFVGAALIAMYASCGGLDIARQVFREVVERDTFCYNAMIRGLAVHGLGLEALELFKKMGFEGLVPDDVTMLVIMCACSHVGLVDQGCKIFESMKDYGIEPKVEHYGTLVDLLGRAGRVKEAEEIVRTIPMKPNAVLWRSLLGAARIHGDLEVGESALKQLIQLEPETSGNYVLLSNMYARLNRWDDVKNVRKLMKDHGVDKAPGSSIVDIDGAMHEFLIGDKNHPQAKRIYLKLDEMNRRMQEHGYKSGTREVLFDIEEEEKEDALSYHSERLAIAYALIASDSGAPIRIIKNLRVCNDCHSVTKLISKIYEREIIVRDRSRFHHFKDGTCSCLDYW